MTCAKLAGGLLLVAVLAPSIQASSMQSMFGSLKRNRRSQFCSLMKKSVDCATKSGGDCNGDCAINKDSGSCEINPMVAANMFDMTAILAPALQCGFGGMGGQESCLAIPGNMCEWTANDDGEMGCSPEVTKLVAAVAGDDEVMKAMVTASVTCEKHNAAKCGMYSECSYNGQKCEANMMSFMSKCSTQGSNNHCKGLEKMGDLYLPCAGLEKDACTAKSSCDYDDDDNECGPGGQSAMSMISDSDVMASVQFMQSATAPCENAQADSCPSSCQASFEKVSYGDEQLYQKVCEPNMPQVLMNAKCGGNILAKYYEIEAKNKKKEAAEAAAVKVKLETKLAEVKKEAAAKKAAYEAAQQAAAACSESCTALQLELSAATTAYQQANATVTSANSQVAAASEAESKFEKTAADADVAAAENAASQLMSSAAAIFAAAAAAFATL